MIRISSPSIKPLLIPILGLEAVTVTQPALPWMTAPKSVSVPVLGSMLVRTLKEPSAATPVPLRGLVSRSLQHPSAQTVVELIVLANLVRGLLETIPVTEVVVA